MALLTNINGKFSVDTDGAASFNRVGGSTTTGFTFPSADGANGYVLKTNGSGTVSWSPDSSPTVYWAANGNDIYNTNSANVGIGTASPDAKLHVEGGIGIFNVSDDWQQSTLGTYLFRGANFATTISNETSTLKIFPAFSGTRTVGDYWGGINFMHLDPDNSTWGTIYTGANFWVGGRVTSLAGQELSALVFAVNSLTTTGSQPTEKMVILPNGNVGIGTDSPDALLELSKSVSGAQGATLRLTNAIGGGGAGVAVEFVGPGTQPIHAKIITVDAGAYDSDLIFQTKVTGTGGALTDRLIIDNVGLATFSSTYIVAGGYGGEVTVGGSSTTFGLQLKYDQGGSTISTLYHSPGYTNDANLFKLGSGSGNTNQLVLKGDGNVGIGTETPYSSLSVIDSNSYGYFSSTSAYRTATFQGSGSTSIVVAADEMQLEFILK